ncbi:MAG: phosphoenolpyruvate synthase [Planctomycetes bacterium]|nr:phosphoenolpyruvate synthase [Planctomycetota bacterium]
MNAPDSRLVLDLAELRQELLPLVGGKNAALGELLRELAHAGVRVPPGFALTTAAWRAHLAAAGLETRIAQRMTGLDVADVRALAAAGSEIRGWIACAPLLQQVATAAREAYADLGRRCGEADTDVAVRSSATAEDLPEASFAGQQETFLNVRGWPALERAIRDCFASLYTDRAIAYRASRGIEHASVALSVGVQKMVRSDLACAGVIFTLDTESGFRDVVLITGAWGLGEAIVQGRVNPDEYWVHKPTLAAGHSALLRRELGTKALRIVYGPGTARTVSEERVPLEDRARFVLGEGEVLQLARWAVAIEEHFSRRAGAPTPMDIEWAKDGRSGELWILQARPETVHARAGPRMELFELTGKGRILVRGKSVGSRIGCGPVRVVHSVAELERFQPGEVLVAEMTDPDWEPVLRRASAVVTDQGGRTCHAAIVSREAGVPCVVGTGTATSVLADGLEVTVSCAAGAEGHVYEGRVPFRREEIDLATLPRPRVPLLVNLADPDQAFRLAALPCAGVGLLRIEFLVTNWIGIHPMACAHPERVEDLSARAEVLRRSSHAGSPAEFFVERLASGVAVIAAAFHPRPVIVRFSDFKTSEYARLLGGAGFEPEEANPMLGFRGASRYYDERYRDGFALECAALRRVRERMGLTNVRVMIPFCRTLGEGRAVLAEMARNGLVRGEGGLEVWVMCEIPNNVVLAAEFSALFDGFSIGSNDLTQLALGVDRDSPLLAHVFDERDPGVKRLIESVVRTAHEHGRPVGICGQAPSDHPEFAEWLAALGIDSISLTPDSLPDVARRLAERQTEGSG